MGPVFEGIRGKRKTGFWLHLARERVCSRSLGFGSFLLFEEAHDSIRRCLSRSIGAALEHGRAYNPPPCETAPLRGGAGGCTSPLVLHAWLAFSFCTGKPKKRNSCDVDRPERSGLLESGSAYCLMSCIVWLGFRFRRKK